MSVHAQFGISTSIVAFSCYIIRSLIVLVLFTTVITISSAQASTQVRRTLLLTRRFYAPQNIYTNRLHTHQTAARTPSYLSQVAFAGVAYHLPRLQNDTEDGPPSVSVRDHLVQPTQSPTCSKDTATYYDPYPIFYIRQSS